MDHTKMHTPAFSDSIAQKLYLAGHSKLILPVSTIPDEEVTDRNRQLAATVAANFASYGYTVKKADIDALAHKNEEAIISFYQTTEPVIKDILGASYTGHPFYPNFPEEVMDKDRLEIFIDQVIYALSGLELSPEKYEEAKIAFPFMGEGVKRSLHLADWKEYEKDIADTCRSAVAFSASQIKEIAEYMNTSTIKESLDNGIFPDDDSIKQKENKIILGILYKEAASYTGDDEYALLNRYLTAPADVIRFAAAESALRKLKKYPEAENEDDMRIEKAMQAASFQYAKKDMPSFGLSRADRRYVIETLERMAEMSGAEPIRTKSGEDITADAEWLAAQMYSHRAEWKRLINQLHVDEIRKYKCSALAEAAIMLHENRSIDRYESRVESAIQRDDIDTALKETSKRPGDFVRRFDKLLRMAISAGKTDELLDLLKECSQKGGIAPTIALYRQIMSRDKNEEGRMFKVKSGAVYTTTDKNRVAIPAPIRTAVKDTCMDGLSAKFTGKGDIGKVYISPSMKDYAVPMAVRELNSGTGVNVAGTSIQLTDTEEKIFRMFIGWNDRESERVDLDLTGELFDADGHWVHVGWNGDYEVKGSEGKKAVIYSGDVQSGQGNARDRKERYGTVSPAIDCGCEYMDFDIAALKKAGFQYAAVGVTIYCGASKFSQIPHASFGYMYRDPKDQGELFEVKTVETRQKLNNDCRMIVPLVLDIQHEKLMYTNFDITKLNPSVYGTGVMSDNIEKVCTLLSIVPDRAENRFSIEDLVRANMKGNNGQQADTPADADIIFMTDAEQDKYLKENGEDSLDGKEIHSPLDYAYYTGVLLAEPVKGEDLFHKEEDSAYEE